jgi:O-acetylhomoserine (thiol)-lyase
MKGFTSQAVHGRPLKADVHGSLRMPVYDSVAFEHASARAMQWAFEGRSPSHSYTRISNPTVEDFEQRILRLSGGTAVVAVASGMAAISGTIMALAGAGSNIITSRHLFGNTLSLFTKTLQPWGLEVRFAAMTDPATVAAAIDGETRAIYLETMTNPQLEVADLAELAAIARENGVPLVVDTTLTTPWLLQSKQAGVNIEIISSTKYISGGATAVGGVIIDNGNFDWRRSPKLASRAAWAGPMALVASLRQDVCRNLGACLAPHNAYLHSLGLETMALRIDRSCGNAMAMASYLEGHEKVAAVHYPGLPSSPYYQRAQKYFGDRGGGILTFDLASREACFAFLDELQLIRRASNINDNKTLALHPASTIFAEYGEDDLREMGVRQTMIRVSAGIEEHEDLISDLERGLAKI